MKNFTITFIITVGILCFVFLFGFFALLFENLFFYFLMFIIISTLFCLAFSMVGNLLYLLKK
jgi:Na+/proline symporter